MPAFILVTKSAKSLMPEGNVMLSVDLIVWVIGLVPTLEKPTTTGPATPVAPKWMCPIDGAPDRLLYAIDTVIVFPSALMVPVSVPVAPALAPAQGSPLP